jgi:hypothetical protein
LGKHERVILERAGDLLAVAVSRRVHRHMAFEAVGHRVEKPRAFSVPNHLGELCRRRVDLEHVIAVDFHARHADRVGARERAVAGRHGVGSGGSRPAVVLADEEHRKLVQRGPVEPFEERAAVHRAVAEEAGHDSLLLADGDGVGRAHGDRDAGRHHAIRAEHADGEVGDVHRAALAAVAAAGAAEELAHHALHRGAFGQRMAVAAVRRGEVVLAGKVQAHAGRDGLLAGRKMQRPAHLRVAERGAEGRHAAARGLLGRILEGADARHRAVEHGCAVVGRAVCCQGSANITKSPPLEAGRGHAGVTCHV